MTDFDERLVTDWKPLKSNDGMVAYADGYIFVAVSSTDGSGYFVFRDGIPLCDTTDDEPVALGREGLTRVLKWTNTLAIQPLPPGLLNTFFWRAYDSD